ncbi:LysR family transcriptional regulator [Staphylococcus massiliensis]|uniref:LysR family transcriptional regulator n=1 Tax=Staphylococcus massiliensis TaxID=555791 RepID=UPI001EDCB10F|nr:LysR family transcriptional regulator [Staphylococcus massiliensis]MCG3402170.1 LysR family transcriptional regulator [Staphylococcus massiliensis]
MNTKQLMIFKHFVEQQNENVVAEMFQISQPTVTFHLKNLQKSYGVPLYLKKGKQLNLTEAGQMLYQNSTKILTLMSETEDLMEDFKTSKRGTLRIGASNAPIYSILPDTVKQYLEAYPTIDVKLSVDTAPRVIEMIHNREVDVGVISENGLPLEGLEVKRLTENPLMLSMDQEHPLASKDDIHLQDIKSYPFVIHSTGSTRESIDEWLNANLLEIDATMQSNNMNSLIETIRGSEFLSLMSACVVNHPDIISKPLPNPPKNRHISLVFKSDRYITPMIQNFISLLYKSI